MCHKSKYCPCGNKAGMCQFDVDKVLDELYEEMEKRTLKCGTTSCDDKK